MRHTKSTLPWLGFPGTRILPLLVAVLSPGLTACHRCPVSPLSLQVNPGGNGVLEPNTAAVVEPTWHYHYMPTGGHCAVGCAPTAPVAGALTNFEGPAGAAYVITGSSANYGAIPLNTSQSCAAGNCYGIKITLSGPRPAAHWDTTVLETTSGTSTAAMDWITANGLTAMAPEVNYCPVQYSSYTWTLHVGQSFTDVPGDGFYPFIETIFHFGITAGCGKGLYCPGSSIRRDQMAVFLLKTKMGSTYVPPPCGGKFADVACPGPFTDWVEDVNNRGIIADCGGGNFCPAGSVLRRDMAVWLLKAYYNASYVPPPATGLFGDVPISDPDAPWIEALYDRQITAGCSANPPLYCPDNSNTRAQMAVFLVKTWGLQLY